MAASLEDTSACPRSSGPRLRLAAQAAALPITATDMSIAARVWMPRPGHQILIDEVLLGWKEFEMEVVRDKADNAIIICAIENVDPMGVHTGDSITVAPALTLTDQEYQMMRTPRSRLARDRRGDRRVERAMGGQPRRRAHGGDRDEPARVALIGAGLQGDRFPDCKDRGQAGVGYTLDELDNDITRRHACIFEPTIDYVVTKIPRFAFEKFPGFRRLTTRDEIGGRGDGHRPHVPRSHAKGAGLDGNGPDRL